MKVVDMKNNMDMTIETDDAANPEVRGYGDVFWYDTGTGYRVRRELAVLVGGFARLHRWEKMDLDKLGKQVKELA